MAGPDIHRASTCLVMSPIMIVFSLSHRTQLGGYSAQVMTELAGLLCLVSNSQDIVMCLVTADTDYMASGHWEVGVELGQAWIVDTQSVVQTYSGH